MDKTKELLNKYMLRFDRELVLNPTQLDYAKLLLSDLIKELGNSKSLPVGCQKAYRLRRIIRGRNYIQVTFPYEVVEKEARSRGLTVDEILSSFHAIAEYGGSKRVIYRLQKNSRRGRANNNDD